MSAAYVGDPWLAFHSKLPAGIAGRVHGTARLKAAVDQATGRGWTVPQLLTEALRDGTVDSPNPGALITDRMVKAATSAPPGGKPSRSGLPFCSPACRENGGWQVSPDTHLPVARCTCRSTQPERTPV